MRIVNAKRRKINYFLTICVFLLSMAIQNLGLLLCNLPDDVKQNVRSLEKVSKKLCKQKCSEVFNYTCLNENILRIIQN